MSDEYDDDVLEQLDAGDTLDVGGPKDWLDEGWSPVERPWAMNAWGTTAREEAAGEGLDRKLARELADVEPADGDGLGDTSDTDGELRDDEVGRSRAGRLVAEDEGGAFDRDKGLFARDAGIDGAGASAEEAAVHLVEE